MGHVPRPCPNMVLKFVIFNWVNLSPKLVRIKALASARGSEKMKKKSKKNQKILPVPIYVFHDSEQKVEFKARIKPCFHQPNLL